MLSLLLFLGSISQQSPGLFEPPLSPATPSYA